MHFTQRAIVGAVEAAEEAPASEGDYQAVLEDISLWPFLVARAGYAMLEWCVSGLEQAAETAAGKNRWDG
jgi:hypothetical protein